MNITGLHHVTAIASNPQRNLDFYVELLGLRLVPPWMEQARPKIENTLPKITVPKKATI